MSGAPLRVRLKDGYTIEVIKRHLPEFVEATGIAVDLEVVDERAAHDAFAAPHDGAPRPDVTTVASATCPSTSARA